MDIKMEHRLTREGGLSILGFHNYISDLSKLTDFSGGIHPAFLSPGYALTPGVRPSARSTSMTHQRGSAFTIDAILSSAPNVKESQSLQENRHPADVRTDRRERTQRVPPYMVQGHCVQRSQSTFTLKDKYSDVEHEVCTETRQKKSKRVRTIFTPEQLERLEAEFERQQYMVGTERFYLATSLNLTEAQVKVWFQNRRIKWRKQNLEQQHKRLVRLGLLQNEEGEETGIQSDSEVETEKVRNITNNNEYVQLMSCETLPLDGAVDGKVCWLERSFKVQVPRSLFKQDG